MNLLHELEEIEKMVNGENSLAGCLIRKEFVRQNVPRGEDRDSFIGGALELYQAAKLIA